MGFNNFSASKSCSGFPKSSQYSESSTKPKILFVFAKRKYNSMTENFPFSVICLKIEDEIT
jgi:hypothetical protein